MQRTMLAALIACTVWTVSGWISPSLAEAQSSYPRLFGEELPQQHSYLRHLRDFGPMRQDSDLFNPYTIDRPALVETGLRPDPGPEPKVYYWSHHFKLDVF